MQFPGLLSDSESVSQVLLLLESSQLTSCRIAILAAVLLANEDILRSSGNVSGTSGLISLSKKQDRVGTVIEPEGFLSEILEIVQAVHV